MKSLLLYLALVGVPVAGLLGILHAGSDLQAPHDVAGEWRVDEIAFPTPGEQRAISALRIKQSGVYLLVSVDGGEQLRGRLRGDTLRVVRPSSGDPARDGCASAGFLLFGIFDLPEDPDMLDGWVVPAGRSRCAGVSFTAVRGSARRSPDTIR